MIVNINNSKFLDIPVDSLMKEFKKLLGQPYVYGGIGTSKKCTSTKCTVHDKDKKYKGFDCSGYVYHVLSKWDYNKFGRSTSQMQSSSGYGQWILNNQDLKVGDLIFYNGHCGVISKISNKTIYMYHATKCGDTIKEAKIDYRKDFTKGLRILKCNLDNKTNTNNDTNNKNQDTYWRVCVTSCKDINEARKILEQVKDKGFKDAFIVEYKK